MARLKYFVLAVTLLHTLLIVSVHSSSQTSLKISSNGEITYGGVIVVAADGSGDVLTIQEGLSLVEPDGEVRVKGSLEYHISEATTFPVKTLTISSFNGKVTIIKDGSGFNGWQIGSGCDVIIDGLFHVMGTSPSQDWDDAGVLIYNAKVIQRGSFIVENNGGVGWWMKKDAIVHADHIKAVDNLCHNVGIGGCSQGGSIEFVDVFQSVEDGLAGLMLSRLNGVPTEGWIIERVEVHRTAEGGDNGIYLDHSNNNIIKNLKISGWKGEEGYLSGGKGLMVKGDGNTLENGEVWGCRVGVMTDEGASYNKFFRINAHDNDESNFVGQDATADNPQLGNEFGWCEGLNAKGLTWGGSGLVLGAYNNENRVHDSTFQGNPKYDIWIMGDNNTFENNTYDILRDDGVGNQI